MTDHSGTRMIDCEEAEQRLHRYVDRELTDAEVADVQRHLEACESCRARFCFEFGLRRLVSRAAQNEPAPEGLIKRIRRLRK